MTLCAVLESSPVVGSSRNKTEGAVISISDCYNRTVKDFTPGGSFIKKYGSSSHKEGQLKCSYGLCTDSKGRVVICNFNGWKVVRCDLSGEEPMWEILLTAQDSNGDRPWCVSVVQKSALKETESVVLEGESVVQKDEEGEMLLIGLAGRAGRLLCYEYH